MLVNVPAFPTKFQFKIRTWNFHLTKNLGSELVIWNIFCSFLGVFWKPFKLLTYYLRKRLWEPKCIIIVSKHLHNYLFYRTHLSVISFFPFTLHLTLWYLTVCAWTLSWTVREGSGDKKNVYRKDMLFFITCLQSRTAVDGILRLQTD